MQTRSEGPFKLNISDKAYWCFFTISLSAFHDEEQDVLTMQMQPVDASNDIPPESSNCEIIASREQLIEALQTLSIEHLNHLVENNWAVLKNVIQLGELNGQGTALLEQLDLEKWVNLLKDESPDEQAFLLNALSSDKAKAMLEYAKDIWFKTLFFLSYTQEPLIIFIEYLSPERQIQVLNLRFVQDYFTDNRHNPNITDRIFELISALTFKSRTALDSFLSNFQNAQGIPLTINDLIDSARTSHYSASYLEDFCLNCHAYLSPAEMLLLGKLHYMRPNAPVMNWEIWLRSCDDTQTALIAQDKQFEEMLNWQMETYQSAHELKDWIKKLSPAMQKAVINHMPSQKLATFILTEMNNIQSDLGETLFAQIDVERYQAFPANFVHQYQKLKNIKAQLKLAFSNFKNGQVEASADIKKYYFEFRDIALYQDHEALRHYQFDKNAKEHLHEYMHESFRQLIQDEKTLNNNEFRIELYELVSYLGEDLTILDATNLVGFQRFYGDPSQSSIPQIIQQMLQLYIQMASAENSNEQALSQCEENFWRSFQMLRYKYHYWTTFRIILDLEQQLSQGLPETTHLYDSIWQQARKLDQAVSISPDMKEELHHTFLVKFFAWKNQPTQKNLKVVWDHYIKNRTTSAFDNIKVQLLQHMAVIESYDTSLSDETKSQLHQLSSAIQANAETLSNLTKDSKSNGPVKDQASKMQAHFLIRCLSNPQVHQAACFILILAGLACAIVACGGWSTLPQYVKAASDAGKFLGVNNQIGLLAIGLGVTVVSTGVGALSHFGFFNSTKNKAEKPPALQQQPQSQKH